MKLDESQTAILLFAHGSSVEDANRGVHALASEVQALGPYSYVRAAFLEQAMPDLSSAVGRAVEAGFARVVVIPFFLTLGVHLRRDLPRLVAIEQERRPGMKIEIGRSLEGHAMMPAMILNRIQEAVAKSTGAR